MIMEPTARKKQSKATRSVADKEATISSSSSGALEGSGELSMSDVATKVQRQRTAPYEPDLNTENGNASDSHESTDNKDDDDEKAPAGALRKRKKANSRIQMKLLPEDFTPSEHDVLCGRGRACHMWDGNRAYRKMVVSKLGSYLAAKTKVDKGVILSDIVYAVRRKSPQGGFVKQDSETGRWHEVGDFLAREKTSQYFRDALHEHYSSGSQAKYNRRKELHQKYEDGSESYTEEIMSEDKEEPEPVEAPKVARKMKVSGRLIARWLL
jgi:hypothetical protein